MHHGSITSEGTVTNAVYRVLTSPDRIGAWQDPLTILLVLREQYGVTVTAISTYISSIRIQLRDLYPERGERMVGPRDGEQPTDRGPGNFYKIERHQEIGQLPLL
jgi:hypothetical protein